MWSATGKKPSQLEVPDCSDDWLYLFDDFYELHSRRSSNGYGPNPISYIELETWSRLTGKFITPQEVIIIMKIDMLYIDSWAKQQRDKK